MKVMVSAAPSLKITVPEPCWAKVQPGGYITDHATGAADENVRKASVDVYWVWAVTQPDSLAPLTCHQPPLAELWPTIDSVTPWEITCNTAADVLGLARRLTPRGAITVSVVGSALGLGVGCGERFEVVGGGVPELEQPARLTLRNARMGSMKLRDRCTFPMAARLLRPLAGG
jgi:hypothetical protein